MEQSELAALYARFGYAVHRRCRRLLGSEAEADDALQEVFMRVQRYGDGLRAEATLPWLYRIADRHCFDVLERRRRWAGPEEAARALDGLAERPSDHDDERVRVVAEVLATMKPRVREVAVLYYVDELTQEEVAEAAGCSRKTVKERLAEFLAGARRVLGADGGADAGRGAAEGVSAAAADERSGPGEAVAPRAIAPSAPRGGGR